MDQTSIIRDLLYWVENNLERPLSLDEVSTKSGYSKWHLQRMFKEVTGQALGTHVRQRRLTKVAVALRLTSRPILELALQYHFDSQQTFTRAFKKQFLQTPASYRRRNCWNTIGLCAPIHLDGQVIPQPELITLPARRLVGITRGYTCKLENIVETHNQIREEFWRNYLGNISSIPPTLYGLHHATASKTHDDEQNVFYSMALEPEDLPNAITGETFILPETRYAMFRYQGKAKELENFMLCLFISCLPSLQLTIRHGYYIEIFHPEESWRKSISGDMQIRFEYLVPLTD